MVTQTTAHVVLGEGYEHEPVPLAQKQAWLSVIAFVFLFATSARCAA